MSRIGSKQIIIPQGVKVMFSEEERLLSISGQNGSSSRIIPKNINLNHDSVDKTITLTMDDKYKDCKKSKALWGLSRAMINNMIIGVDKGFSKVLIISGTGYRARLDGSVLIFSLGYSHDIYYSVAKELKVKLMTPTKIEISGIDKQQVGQCVAMIIAFRPMNPYKNRGIIYEGQVVTFKKPKKNS